MARHHTRLQKTFDLKPKAFRLFCTLADGRPAVGRLLSFFPRLGRPDPARIEMLDESVQRFALAQPRYRPALQQLEHHNVDVADGSALWQDPMSARRLAALVEDVIVPGHTLTPVDPSTARQVSLTRPMRSYWAFAHPGPCVLREVRIAGATVVVPPYRHYGHLLTDVLFPAFFAIELLRRRGVGTVTVLTPAAPNALVQGFVAAVRALGLAVDHHEAGIATTYRLERLVYARSDTPNAERNFAYPEMIAPLSAAFRAAYRDRAPRAAGRAVYLQRQGARLRHVEGEERLIDILAARGFAVFVPDWANHPEQIETFAAADVVVGVHGAGLANMLFARRDALLIELMAGNARKTTGLHWASSAGADYHAVFGGEEWGRQHFAIPPEAVADEICGVIAARRGSAPPPASEAAGDPASPPAG